MNDRCFIDTNVFVYSFDPSDPLKARVAQRLIQGELKKRTGVVSFQVIQEFFNVALKRFPAFVASHDAELYLSTFFAHCWEYNPRSVSTVRHCGFSSATEFPGTTR